MQWKPESEEALQVIGRILIRQLGLPEKTTITTDFNMWIRMYSWGKPVQEDLRAQSVPKDYMVYVNVDHASNFYDTVASLTHELFHLRRPRVNDEYKINNWAYKWINHDVYKFVDMKEL